MTDDLDAMFDDPKPAPKKRGRPKGSTKKILDLKVTAEKSMEQAAAYQAKIAEFQQQEPDPETPAIPMGEEPDAALFRRPVTRTFLATVFGVEPRRLVQKLAKCPIIGHTERGLPLYDFKEAVDFFAEPKGDIGDWIMSQNQMSLPPAINKAFWDAMRSRQMVEERAGDLWRTADVLEVLGRTAINIKDTAKLWIENMPGKEKLSTEQYDSLRRAVDDLLRDIHQRLVDMPKEKQTRSSAAEYEGMLAGEAGDE